MNDTAEINWKAAIVIVVWSALVILAPMFIKVLVFIATAFAIGFACGRIA